MLDLNCLLLEDTNIENVLELSKEIDFFKNTIDYLIESNNIYHNTQKELYKSLLESNLDIVLVTESFSDYTNKIKFIISKFIKFIKKMYDRFILYMNKFMQADKYINNHMKLLSKFSKEDEFDIEGYYYTFNNDIPVINPVASMSLDFIGLDGLNSTSEKKEFLKEKYNKLKENLNNGYYDSVRASVLNQEGKIYQDDFADELFKVFRDKNKDKRSITIGENELENTISLYKNYKESLKAITDTKKDIEAKYKDLESSMGKLANITIVDNNIPKSSSVDFNLSGIDSLLGDTECVNTINLFIKSKVDQITELSKIHSLAFGAKLESYKQCMVQSKYVLYKAIDTIIKKGGNQ